LTRTRKIIARCSEVLLQDRTEANTMSNASTSPISRRVLLGGALGALGASLAATIGRPLPVAATADGVRYVNDENDDTVLEAVSEEVGEGTGGGTAISGRSAGGPGVVGASAANIGVLGQSDSSTGVSGVSTEGVGIAGYSTTDVGVVGTSDAGRGGAFSGQLAQVRLVPPGRHGDNEIGTGQRRHPASGLRGDLFCDAAGRLWFCRGGEDWARLA
jgi:hypothetical protein